MKISKGILLLLFSILLNDSFGKSKIASLIYNSKGELIADSSFRITKKQLKKFVKIEARFTKQLLDSIKIAPELIQDGIGFKVIVEFDVDEHSCFSNVNIIKIPPSPVEKFIRRHAQKTFIDQILQSSCQF